jgi:hypothetical protein
MTTVTFDTLRFVETLKAAGVSEAQAKAGPYPRTQEAPVPVDRTVPPVSGSHAVRKRGVVGAVEIRATRRSGRGRS